MESYIKGLNDEINICAKKFKEFKKYLYIKLYDASLNKGHQLKFQQLINQVVFNYFNSRKNYLKFHDRNISFEKNKSFIKTKMYFLLDESLHNINIFYNS